MTGMLASVRNLGEAMLVCKSGADIVDLKEPDHGALGAAPLEEIHRTVDELWEKCIISATIGDLPADTFAITNKVLQIAETGVDYVKVGMFSDQHLEVCLPKLVHCANKGIAIVAVFFADMEFDVSYVIHAAKRARLKGVMLDTAHKNSGSLLKHKSIPQLEHFIDLARQNNLLTGLAGSLKVGDISTLLELNPDYIGFRTALCANKDRTNNLNLEAIQQIRVNIPLPSDLQKKSA